MHPSTARTLSVGSASVATVLSAAVTLAAPQEISRMLNGALPEEPQRDRIEVVLGVDDTPGENSTHIGDVRTAVNSVIKSGMLEIGDHIVLCKIGGQGKGANCNAYTIEDEKGKEANANASLQADLADFSGKRQYTWFRPAINTMAERSNPDHTRVGFVWSGDFIDGSPATTLSVPYDLNLVVTDPKYASNATTLCAALPTDCTVTVAPTATAVGNALIRDIAPLKEEQKASYLVKMIRFREAQQTNASTVMRFTGAFMLITTFCGAVLSRLLRKPHLRGAVVDVRGQKPDVIFLKEFGETGVNLRSLRPTLPSLYLDATHTGLHHESRDVFSGQEILPGIFYFSDQDLPNDDGLVQLKTT